MVNGQAGATSCRTWGAMGEKVDFLRKKGARCLTSSTMLIEWLFKKIFRLDKFWENKNEVKGKQELMTVARKKDSSTLAQSKQSCSHKHLTKNSHQQ